MNENRDTKLWKNNYPLRKETIERTVGDENVIQILPIFCFFFSKFNNFIRMIQKSDIFHFKYITFQQPETIRRIFY